jgi:hypothetical protein
MSTTPVTTAAAKNMCVRALQMMADGTLEDFRAVVHPHARNREDVAEPPASRGRGPAAFYATALWLRDAYAELRWVVHQGAAEGDLVVLHATMSGRHVGTFVKYNDVARPCRRSHRPVSGSRPPRRTGSASPMTRSSSIGPIGTTWAPRCNSAGLPHHRGTWPGCCSRPAGFAGRRPRHAEWQIRNPMPHTDLFR